MIRKSVRTIAPMVATLFAWSTPGEAIIVFDPSNYAQNALEAARALQQIDNQVRALQNQATMLINMAHNLGRVNFPELGQITTALNQAEALLRSGSGIGFNLATLDSQFTSRFPSTANPASTSAAQLAAAQSRVTEALAAYRQAMAAQSQIVGSAGDDTITLGSLSNRSQSAEGALSAAQAGNQLTAFLAKQQIQIEQLMAAQYRADSVERASRVQGSIDAAAATRRFLGSGTAYTPR